jgi:hypothetical protein
MTQKVSFAKVLFFVSLSCFVAIACDKNTEQTTYTIFGSANASQETPPTNSSGTGMVSGTYNKNTHVLNYNVTWNGLTGNATGAHFHGPADIGQKANVLIPITITNTPSGNASGSVTLPDSTANFFLNGKMYYNVHTAANPGGEIRAQVSLQ